MHAHDIVHHVSAESCVTLLDTMGNDARVVNAARVSFARWVDESKALDDKDKKLISYLAEHEHDSPFFHPVVCFRIKMPIFVAREWYRHTVGFARNEVSRRYVDTGVECFVPACIRARDIKVKQGSLPTPVVNDELSKHIMRSSMDFAVSAYRMILAQGAAPEVARMVLPVAMFTEFIETASLAAYARLYSLRHSPDAQLEIREYATIVGQLLANKFPVAWHALTNNA